MKFRILALLAIVVLFVSCSDKKDKTTASLNPSNLMSVFISLNPDSAYSLITPKGAVLKIGINSFDVKGSDKVDLEVKEAFSIQDMLLAGLTTRSNGKLLQSGGMIYINATSKGKAVDIVKPINVSIPTAMYDVRMQLFKGEVEDDGSINWVNPTALDTSPALTSIINGKALFKANCASCHKPTIEFTAPPLALARLRAPDRDWPYRFTKNPAAMYGADPYANYLFKKYNKIMMTAFPLLTREEMNAILDYCDNEAIKYPMPATTTAVLDSGNVQAVNFCGYDTIYYPLADTIIKPFPVVSATDSVSNTPYQPPVYEFNIDRSGWYNVDCFINTYENAALLSKVNLSASLKMSKQAYIQVYLCIPTRKLLTYGNESGKKKYTFENSDGSISLIKNDEAFIFVIGADTTSAYYGITKFLVKDNQDIIVNVKASTKEEILNAIKRNKLDSLKIDIEKPETYIIQALVNDTAKKGGPAENMQMQIMERPCIGDSFKMKRTGDLFQ